MVEYTVFKNKYSSFANLEESKFNIFLGDAIAIMQLHPCKGLALEGLALEMLLGYLLESSSQVGGGVLAAGGIKSLAVDGEYTVTYEGGNSSTSKSWFKTQFDDLTKLCKVSIEEQPANGATSSGGQVTSVRARSPKVNIKF